MPGTMPDVDRMGCAEIAIDNLKKWAFDPKSLDIIECQEMEAVPYDLWSQKIFARGKNAAGNLIVTGTEFTMSKQKIERKDMLNKSASGANTIQSGNK